MNDLQKKLHSDQQLRERAADFLRKTFAAAAVSDADVVAAWDSMSMRMVDGSIFAIDSELRESERQLVIRAMELLGGKYGSEKDASDAVWAAAANHLHTSGAAGSDDVAALVGGLTAHTKVDVECILPNRLLLFAGDVTEIQIGSVRVERGADIARRLRTPRNLTFSVGTKEPGFPEIADSGHLTSQVYPLCWCVKMSAAKSNWEEEAVWLIDTATSLLRLAHQKSSALFPALGAIEPHPCERSRIHNEMIVATPTGVNIGGTSLSASYEITAEVKGWLLADPIKKWAASVFEPKKKSVAERVHAGLGWLSRGRQARGRAERLLFAFTALEALLTSGDKAAPVVQTVSRHLAVLLAEEPRQRIAIARDLRRLYDHRSAVVHSGRREVSKGSANSVQMLAEEAYHRVIRSVDPEMLVDTFHQDLADASYGLPWLGTVWRSAP